MAVDWKRVLAAALALALVGGAIALLRPEPPRAPEAEPAAVPVTGRLRDAKGAPAAGVTLAWRGAGSAVTDAEGRFALPPPPRGPGAPVLGVAGPQDAWTALRAVADPSAPLDVRLVPADAIAGVVLAADGRRPLAAVDVRVVREERPAGDPEQGRDAFVRTGADGRFRIEHLPPGRYRVTVERDGLEPCDREVVVPGAPVEIVLPTARRLEVRFEGLPDAWRSARVYLLLDDIGGGAVYEGFERTIADGRVFLPAPPPGRYTLGQVPGAGHPLPALYAEVTVADGPLAPVVLRLPANAVVFGRLTYRNGRPVAGAVLRLATGDARATTGADGVFELRGVPVGPNRIGLAAASGVTYVGEVTVPAAGRKELAIRLHGTAAIHGRAPPGTALRLARADDGVTAAEGKAGPDGTFLLVHLRAGDYVLETADSRRALTLSPGQKR